MTRCAAGVMFLGLATSSASASPNQARSAADVQLAIVETAYAKWDTYQITKIAMTPAMLYVEVRHLNDQRMALEVELDKLAAYASLDIAYAMAAELRRGDVEFTYGLKLGAMPPPKVSPARYQQIANTLPNIGASSADAKARWEHVLEMAKVAHVRNRWSTLAREELVREFPTEYEPFHDEIIEGTDRP